MMTREEYIRRKADIEAAMGQSRRDQHHELAALNEQYELRLREEGDEHRRRRQAIFDERDAARQEIEEKYKDVRRDLWSQDAQLIEEWRKGLRRDEVTVGGQGVIDNLSEGAMMSTRATPPHDGRPYVRICDKQLNEKGGEL